MLPIKSLPRDFVAVKLRRSIGLPESPLMYRGYKKVQNDKRLGPCYSGA